MKAIYAKNQGIEDNRPKKQYLTKKKKALYGTKQCK